MTFGHAVQPGYLAQLRDAAIPGTTVLDAILAVIPITPGEARGYLARFLFRGDDAFKEVRLLSGGERSRLELALLGILPSNLLLLDEPTNHLDIAAREAIEAFLAEVAGDDHRRVARPAAARDDLRAPVGGRRRARGAVRRRLARVAGGGGRGLDVRPSRPRRRDAAGRGKAPAAGRCGRVAALRSRSATAAAPSATGAVAVAAPRPKVRQKLSKDAYRRQRGRLDGELTRLGLRKSQLELAVGTPAVAANFVEMRRVTSELADVERALAEAEDAWLELEEQAP